MTGWTWRAVWSRLTTASWWKAAGLRMLYTAGAAAVPYLGGALLVDVPWITLLNVAALAAVASFLTSVCGLPEVVGNDYPWWLAAVERVGKTFAQTLLAGFLGATLLTDVPWTTVLQAAALASLASFVRLILATLPADPTASAPAVTSGPAVQNVSLTVTDPTTTTPPAPSILTPPSAI